MLVVDDDEARLIVDDLIGSGETVGLDIETKPNPDEAAAAETAIAAMAAREAELRRAGKAAMVSSDPTLTKLRSMHERASKAPLYPGRGEIRLVQALCRRR